MVLLPHTHAVVVITPLAPHLHAVLLLAATHAGGLPWAGGCGCGGVDLQGAGATHVGGIPWVGVGEGCVGWGGLDIHTAPIWRTLVHSGPLWSDLEAIRSHRGLDAHLVLF